MLEQTLKNNNIKKLIAVSVGHFTNDFYANLIAPISYLFALKLGLNLTQQGIISTVILIFATFFQPFFGLYADKRGKSGILIFSVLWIAIWTSISGLINNYYILLIVLAVGSLASALYHPLGSTAAVNLGERTKGTSLSVFMTIGGFAGSLSPIVALWIAQKYGLEKIALLVIPGIIISIYMYISKVQAINIKSDIVEKITNERQDSNLNKKRIIWLAVLIFITLVKTLTARFAITYGIQILTLKNVSIAAIILSTHLFGRPLGTMIGGILIDKIGGKKVFILGMISSLICISLIVFENSIVAAISFAILGFCLSLTSTISVLLSHSIIPNSQSFATGMIMGIPGGLGSLSMIIFSSIADMRGLIYSFKLLIIPFIIVTILTIIMPHKYK